MQISATIADWDYVSSRSTNFWSDFDETKRKDSVFTLWNDSFIMNCDFAELYVAQRAHLPQQILPYLDQFLANCAPNVSAALELPPDYDLPAKVDVIWSALSPRTVQQRLAAILSDQDCMLYDAVPALAERFGDHTGRTDPVIDNPHDVVGFLQLWIGVHAEALATSRGFFVTGN